MHQSDTVQLDVGIPRGSSFGPLLFAVYCSPVAEVVSQHGVKYHQYVDDWLLVKVLAPTRHKIRHFGDVPEASLLAWYGKTNLTQQELIKK